MHRPRVVIAERSDGIPLTLFLKYRMRPVGDFRRSFSKVHEVSLQYNPGNMTLLPIAKKEISWPRGFLLLFENRVEHRFLHVGLDVATFGIDEWICASGLELCILALHVVLGRVISK